MAQRDPNTEKSANSSALNFPSIEFAEMGKQRFEAAVEIQNKLLDKLQEMNREWLARVQSEVELASDISSKLTTARSLPEVATAYQEWASRRMSMLAEDGRRFIADGQRLVETGARLFSNGRSSGA